MLKKKLTCSVLSIILTFLMVVLSAAAPVSAVIEMDANQNAINKEVNPEDKIDPYLKEKNGRSLP